MKASVSAAGTPKDSSADWTLITGLAGVYYQTAGEDDNHNSILDSTEDANSNGLLDFGSAWKPKSFQIISPGFDGQYGLGGVFDPATADTVLSGAREAERDNIANFHGGTLVN